MGYKSKKKLLISLLKRYWLQIVLIVFISNFGIIYAIRYLSRAQTCYTKEQVSSDSRCLYIWSEKVFEIGSKSKPHHGHPCGMDVTAIIPGFHLADMVKYMDPNYLGNICTASQPTITITPIPPSVTPVPSNTPYPTPTVTVSPVPTIFPSPTNIPLPTLTNTPTPTSTNIPTFTQTPSPTYITRIGEPTTVPFPTNTSIPVPSLTNIPSSIPVPTLISPIPTVLPTVINNSCSPPGGELKVVIYCPLCGQ